MAATYSLRQVRTHQSDLIQFALFICGGPGFDVEGARFVLTDESDRRIGLPPVHVYGSWDPLVASLALYNTCDGIQGAYSTRAKVMPCHGTGLASKSRLDLEPFRKTA